MPDYRVLFSTLGGISLLSINGFFYWTVNCCVISEFLEHFQPRIQQLTALPHPGDSRVNRMLCKLRVGALEYRL